jgi:hypothetical protein
MPADLTPRHPGDLDILSRPLVRQTNRTLDQIEARSIVRQALVEAEAEHAAHVIKARNAVAAAAAQADAQLSGLLAALPIQDESDADFKRQLQQATRANVIADLYRFRP